MMSTSAELGWTGPALDGLTVAHTGGLGASYASWLLQGAGADTVRLDVGVDAAFSGAESARFRHAVDSSLHASDAVADASSVGAWVRANQPDVLIVDYTALPRRERADLHRVLESLDDVGTVICSIRSGPLTSAHGSDDAEWSELIAMSASGFLSLGGYPDEQPSSTNGHLAACAAGAHAAVAIAAQLVARARGVAAENLSCIDVDATECLLPALETALQFWHSERVVRTRRGAVLEAGHGTFACADGFISMVAAGLGDFAWERFCGWFESLGGTDTFRDEKWLDRSFRSSPEGRDEFTRTFEATISTHSRGALSESGQGAGVPVAGVNQLREVLDDAQLRHRQAWTGDERNRRLLGPYRVRQRGASGADPHQSARALGHEAGEPTAAKPLAGLRVLDFTWVGAGPFTTRILADLGADVVKVESSSRLDPLRSSPPFSEGVPGVDRSAYFANRNAGKRTISVNLKHPSAPDVVGRLAAQADVVINSFGAGVLARLGFPPEFFHRHRPSIIHVDMPLHGTTGPHASHIGFGGMINAAGGYHALSRFDDRTPTGTGTNFPDHVPNPLHALFALLIGVLGQVRDGEGVDIEVSQFESGITFLAPELTYTSQGGKLSGALNAISHTAPRGLFDCLDGRSIAIEIVSRGQWLALCELLDDDRLVHAWELRDRQRNSEVILEAISDFCGRHGAARTEGLLQDAGVPAAVMRNAAEVCDSDATWVSKSVVTLQSPGFGEVLYTCLPFRLGGEHHLPVIGAPALGAHTREVLQEWGALSEPTIDELTMEGVLE